MALPLSFARLGGKRILLRKNRSCIAHRPFSLATQKQLVALDPRSCCGFFSTASRSHQQQRDDNNTFGDNDEHQQQLQAPAQAHDDISNSKLDERWNQNFAKLKACVEKMKAIENSDDSLSNRSLSLTRELSATDMELKSWFDKQRHLYQRTVVQMEEEDDQSISNAATSDENESDGSSSAGLLSEERQARLESLGVSLHPRQDFWEMRYMHLVDFLKRNNGLFPYDFTTQDLDEEDLKLYWWCRNQRKAYKLYKDSSDSHDSKKDKTNRKNDRVPYTKPATMTPEREALLNEIGFCWNARTANWEARYAELKAYSEEHGDCLVPIDYPANLPLGTWVGEQRTHMNYMSRGKPSSMTPRRIELLNRLDFAWNAQDARWLERYKEVKDHVARNGLGSLPHRKYNKSLRRWVDRQRGLYRKREQGETTTMTDERARLWEKLGYMG